MDETALMLFAQMKKGGGAEAVGALGAVFTICLLVVVYVIIPIIAIGLAIFFYVSAFQALNSVSQRNRDMEPAMIFLMLIPCFGIVWYFFVVIRIASSLKKEYEDRGMREDGDFGQLLGILAPLIPCVGAILHIMWIMKIRGYTKRLTAAAKRSGDDD